VKLEPLEMELLAVVIVLLLLTALFSGLYLEGRAQIASLNDEVNSLQSTLRQYESEVSSLQSQVSSLLDQINNINGIPSQDLRLASQNVTITINGLTCQMPTPEPQILYTLVPQIVQDPRFLNLTQGAMYAFGNGEEMTGSSETVENVTTRLTDIMEAVFYTYNSSAVCGPPTSLVPWTNTISVHVPYENGNFNMADATFGRLFP
jgi:cell division protein FtsL